MTCNIPKRCLLMLRYPENKVERKRWESLWGKRSALGEYKKGKKTGRQKSTNRQRNWGRIEGGETCLQKKRGASKNSGLQKIIYSLWSLLRSTELNIQLSEQENSYSGFSTRLTQNASKEKTCLDCTKIYTMTKSRPYSKQVSNVTEVNWLHWLQ